jgi:MtN3 and saliva related transmembrane protein
MDLATFIGAAAALTSTLSFAPQAWRITATRETSAISLSANSLTVVAFSLWTTYGMLKMDWPLIVPNAICLAMAAFILMMKALPQRKKEKVADAIDPRS